VLTGIGPLQVATRYRGPEGAEFDSFPYHQSILHKATAVYESLPGWDEDITAVRRFEDLPQEAQDYLHFVENFVGVPIALVGVGPARDQVIEIDRSAPLRRAA
jgi:adenylosuccinate synthase